PDKFLVAMPNTAGEQDLPPCGTWPPLRQMVQATGRIVLLLRAPLSASVLGPRHRSVLCSLASPRRGAFSYNRSLSGTFNALAKRHTRSRVGFSLSPVSSLAR